MNYDFINSNSISKKYLDIINEKFNDLWIYNNFIFLKKDDSIDIIWCSVCSEFNIVYDQEGEKIINNKKCIKLSEFDKIENIEKYPYEWISNIYLCPQCNQTLQTGVKFE